LDCIEFTQNVGETVYVPSGWWHAVLNISPEPTVCVTHNIVREKDIMACWRGLIEAEENIPLAMRWKAGLQQDRPELAQYLTF
jgi:dTDP-4-dehydrorhamnose 3,5-epimerase-like enzyme